LVGQVIEHGSQISSTGRRQRRLCDDNLSGKPPVTALIDVNVLRNEALDRIRLIVGRQFAPVDVDWLG
jgi:hypothetical protein